ncbi:hypothetical protein CCHL11_01162 [Colletotrichum chlorophyti]|uniref:Glutamine repeat protein-1 n=1 Tax=Colletotrichum chlorophyti TaxID=708187 RepID=A0A1Q8S8A5_9PEZI|nr:hypothetical protein CCHL11_01162 [Colletotrichum chlorophyti]
MYAPGYFQVPNVPPNFNTGAPPPNQNPHMQQGSVPTQSGQQMMYNPNQFAGMPGGQPGFVGGPNAAMMAGGPAGMMQNAGMPHMGSNGQMAFQNPYQSNPYGGNMPTPVGQHPNFSAMPGFPMNAGSMTPQQQQQMMMQQQQQRMQAQQQGQANQGGMPLGSTPQRPMSAAQGGHGSPNNAMQQQQQQPPQQQHQSQHQQQQAAQQQQQPQQPQQIQHQQQQHHQQHHHQQQHQQHQQHQPQQHQHAQQQQNQQQQHAQQPQHAQQQQAQHQPHQHQHQQPAQQQPQFPTSQTQPHGQAPNSTAQQQANSVTTPQTPTFPSHTQNPSINGASSVSTPLSPGSESREQERFSLLLEINQELLFESMQLQHTVSELKKESGASGEGDHSRKVSQDEAAVQQDYNHCMRRLQANLAYLAALADRKGNVQVPPSPAYLSAPPLNMTLRIRYQTPPGDVPENNPDPSVDREERNKYLTGLYTKLQGLFPNADPKKEPAFQTPARPQGQQSQGSRTPSHQASPAMAQAQRPMQMQNMTQGMIPS